MTIDEITEKIIESKNNDIAKAFTMHIGSLLSNNGIVPVMTEYTVKDIKNITNRNEHFASRFALIISFKPQVPIFMKELKGYGLPPQ